jgi:hypothetical protein
MCPLERLAELEDVAVARPKVMSPGRDAVRFIDHQESDRKLQEKLEAIDMVELFGRGEEDLDLTGEDSLARECIFLFSLVTVDRGGCDVKAMGELVDLVTYEG